MFPKIRRRLSALCTAVAGGILLLLGLSCFLFAQKGIREGAYSSFSQELGVILSRLQWQDVISHEWLGQLQEEKRVFVFLYDNGKPLYYMRLQGQGGAKSSSLQERAGREALSRLGSSIFEAGQTDQSPRHEEFALSISGGEYYVSAGSLQKSGGRLCFLILCPLSAQSRQIAMLRLAIFLACLIALSALAAFFWFFTGKMLEPLEEGRRRQNGFVAAASHELRSPLAVTLSALESLEKAGGEEERRHFAGIMRSEIERMRRLVSDMLFLANSDSGALNLTPAQEQADDLLLCIYESSEVLAGEKGVRLRLEIPDQPLPPLSCDREYLLLALQELISNAISYTPKGGTVTLSLSLAPGIKRRGGGPVFRFLVSDSGPGIPDDEKKRVFTRFYRAQGSRSDKGHFGLGLGIVSEIAAAHGGRVWAEDAPEGGALFVLEVPSAAAATPSGT